MRNVKFWNSGVRLGNHKRMRKYVDILMQGSKE